MAFTKLSLAIGCAKGPVDKTSVALSRFRSLSVPGLSSCMAKVPLLWTQAGQVMQARATPPPLPNPGSNFPGRLAIAVRSWDSCPKCGKQLLSASSSRLSLLIAVNAPPVPACRCLSSLSDRVKYQVRFRFGQRSSSFCASLLVSLCS
jgi:hypothetical protein